MKIRQGLSIIVMVVISFSGATGLNAADKPASNQAAKDQSAIDDKIINQVETLKKQLIQLNSELYQFEEDLLYPADTQLAVFLSITAENTFILDSVEILLDDKLITSYLYKENEISALKKGGVQRLYLGSLSDGRHKLTARFNGQGANNRYFRRKKALPFTKEHDAKFIQLVVTENKTTREPLFKVKQW